MYKNPQICEQPEKILQRQLNALQHYKQYVIQQFRVSAQQFHEQEQKMIEFFRKINETENAVFDEKNQLSALYNKMQKQLQGYSFQNRELSESSISLLTQIKNGYCSKQNSLSKILKYIEKIRQYKSEYQQLKCDILVSEAQVHESRKQRNLLKEKAATKGQERSLMGERKQKLLQKEKENIENLQKIQLQNSKNSQEIDDKEQLLIEMERFIEVKQLQRDQQKMRKEVIIEAISKFMIKINNKNKKLQKELQTMGRLSKFQNQLTFQLHQKLKQLEQEQRGRELQTQKLKSEIRKKEENLMMLQNVSEHLRNLKDAHSQLNFFKRDSTLINLNLGGLYLQNINRNITMEEPNQECQGNKELIRTGLTNITNY